MKDVLSIITVNTNPVEPPQFQRTINQAAFPYRICDISLPQCNTWYVYVSITERSKFLLYLEN